MRAGLAFKSIPPPRVGESFGEFCGRAAEAFLPVHKARLDKAIMDQFISGQRSDYPPPGKPKTVRLPARSPADNPARMKRIEWKSAKMLLRSGPPHWPDTVWNDLSRIRLRELYGL